MHATPLLADAAQPSLADLWVVPLSAAAVWGWLQVFRRVRSGSAPLTYEPRRPIRWGGREALIVVAAYLVTMSAMRFVADRTHRPDAAPVSPETAESTTADPQWFADRMRAKVVGDAAFLAVMVVFFGFVLATPRDEIGFASRPAYDLRTGLAAFVLIVPPVLLLQLALSLMWRESAHPVLHALKQSRDFGVVFWSGLAVVAGAPLVEEFLFRGVIQNWLENLAERRFAGELATSAGDATATDDCRRSVPPDGPIVVTSAIFALVHLGNGPDPIPLFFLSLGLGYLFRQTHRIWPGWVVHTLLNAFSFTMVLLGAA